MNCLRLPAASLWFVPRAASCWQIMDGGSGENFEDSAALGSDSDVEPNKKKAKGDAGCTKGDNKRLLEVHVYGESWTSEELDCIGAKNHPKVSALWKKEKDLPTRRK